MRKFLQTFAVVMVCSGLALAQGSRKDDIAMKVNGGYLSPVPGALIRACSTTATGTPCTPTATVYTDKALSSPMPLNGSGQFAADAQGNYGFYSAACVQLQITDPSSGQIIQQNDVCPPSLSSPAGYDANPVTLGADTTGVTDAQSALQAAIESKTTPNGLDMYIPSGTYLVNTPLHIDHTMHLSGAGGAPGTPATLLQLGPGAYVQVDFPGTNAGNTSGRGDFSLIENLKIQGTQVSCTATSGSLVLTGCPAGVATKLALTAGQPVTVMGTLSTPGWGLAFPQFTTVGSTTSTTITLVSPGTSGSNFTGSVTVMNAGPLIGAGTTTDGSAVITGVTNCAQWNGGDPIFGPGIPYVNSTTPATTTPRFMVTSKNCGANTITLNHPASAASAPYAPGAGNFYKAPIANLMVKGPPHLHDLTIEYSAGDCLFMAADGAWVTSADGWRSENLRALHCGGASLYTAGGDANAGLSTGLFASYSVEGCVLDWSFLGNTYMGGECASQGMASSGPGGITTGGGYNALNLNGANLFLNPYLEGGNVAPKYTGSALLLGGVSTPFSTGGNFITNAGVMSPTFYTANYNESQGDFLTGNAVITNVTNISHWHVGDTMAGWCTSSAVTVSATDGVSQLTMNKVANCTQTQQWFSHSGLQQYIGAQSNLQSAGGFGITKDQTSIFTNELQWREYNATDNWGWFCYLWRNSTENMCFSSDYAVGKEVPPNVGTGAYGSNGGRIKFPGGIYLGNGASSNLITVNAGSATAPTVGSFGQGAWALAGSPISSSPTAAFVQTGTDIVISSGHISITAGSTAFTAGDATFQTCAPNNWITGTDIENDTIIFTTSGGAGTLSRPALATTTETVSCGRLPKAHTASTVTTNSTTTVTVNTGSATWANGDYIAATGIPANTWIVSGGGTGTIVLSQSATTTGGPNAATDPNINWSTVALGASTALTLQTGGVNNASQSTLNETSGTFVAATNSSGGVVVHDLSATGSPTSSTFLRGDNTWATPSGAGTVTHTAGSLAAGDPVIGNGTADLKTVGPLYPRNAGTVNFNLSAVTGTSAMITIATVTIPSTLFSTGAIPASGYLECVWSVHPSASNTYSMGVQFNSNAGLTYSSATTAQNLTSRFRAYANAGQTTLFVVFEPIALAGTSPANFTSTSGSSQTINSTSTVTVNLQGNWSNASTLLPLEFSCRVWPT